MVRSEAAGSCTAITDPLAAHEILSSFGDVHLSIHPILQTLVIVCVHSNQKPVDTSVNGHPFSVEKGIGMTNQTALAIY